MYMMTLTEALISNTQQNRVLGKCSLRSMAVLSSRAQERRSREIRARTSGEAARKISCFRPNLLAVSLPSPAFIT